MFLLPLHSQHPLLSRYAFFQYRLSTNAIISKCQHIPTRRFCRLNHIHNHHQDSVENIWHFVINFQTIYHNTKYFSTTSVFIILLVNVTYLDVI